MIAYLSISRPGSKFEKEKSQCFQSAMGVKFTILKSFRSSETFFNELPRKMMIDLSSSVQFSVWLYFLVDIHHARNSKALLKSLLGWLETWEWKCFEKCFQEKWWWQKWSFVSYYEIQTIMLWFCTLKVSGPLGLKPLFGLWRFLVFFRSKLFRPLKVSFFKGFGPLLLLFRILFTFP